MDPNLLTLFKLSLIFVNMLMTRGLSDADGADQLFTQRPRLLQCNQTLLLLEMERCGERFSSDMNHVHPDDRCNLTHFIREYHVFSFCTEMNAERIGCFWPNPAVERFIISIHKHFFSNCSLEHVFLDPPDHTLTLLILVPVFLTLAMVLLVVWCSKRSDILA
ncbi:receptor activity-modifying protein 3-like isoform X2 [Sinocyclocheilus rhinocerous]|uniref:receptor activity-modifying protein 3-like isoform X2 n=1 Tax=Sinocyclocheilus rhinocerous TaxID=307959 RepID=UPI0007B9B45B|nr:PREDICTED: receptor activity-modifying protein 3-like isoform X2 [Sinocyclocheilus rhinocerous]